jgi:hypothetical protein
MSSPALPHSWGSTMKWSRAPSTGLGARVATIRRTGTQVDLTAHCCSRLLEDRRRPLLPAAAWPTAPRSFDKAL